MCAIDIFLTSQKKKKNGWIFFRVKRFTNNFIYEIRFDFVIMDIKLFILILLILILR